MEVSENHSSVITVNSEMTGGDDEDEKFIIIVKVSNQNEVPISNVQTNIFNDGSLVTGHTDINGEVTLKLMYGGLYQLELLSNDHLILVDFIYVEEDETKLLYYL